MVGVTATWHHIYISLGSELRQRHYHRAAMACSNVARQRKDGAWRVISWRRASAALRAPRKMTAAPQRRGHRLANIACGKRGSACGIFGRW